jgi:hypothetical protein
LIDDVVPFCAWRYFVVICRGMRSAYLMNIRIRVTDGLQIRKKTNDSSSGQDLVRNCLTDEVQAGIHEHRKK